MKLRMGVKVREKVKGSGAWWVFVHHRGRRTSVKVGSKRAAEKVAEEIEARITLGKSPLQQRRPTTPRLEDYWNHFKATYLSTAVRDSTRASYQHNFKNHILPDFGSQPLDQISVSQVERFIAKLVVEKGLAKDTVDTIIKQLRRLFNYARKRKVVSENPASGLGQLYSQAPVRHERIDPLNPREVTVFLRKSRKHSPQHLALFLAAIHTGLRQGELVGLQWGDIDWNGQYLLVRRSIDRVHRKITHTKNSRIRRVDLPDELLCELAALRRVRKQYWLSKGNNRMPDWVFHNEDGGWLDASNLVRRHFKKCLTKAELHERRFHDLRHTFASLLLTAGAPIAYVSEQLGHSSIELTVKRYGHLTPGANRPFVNNLPGLKTAPYAHPGRKHVSTGRVSKVDKSKEIKRIGGAGNGIRTRDFNLGKVALYH